MRCRSSRPSRCRRCRRSTACPSTASAASSTRCTSATSSPPCCWTRRRGGARARRGRPWPGSVIRAMGGRHDNRMHIILSGGLTPDNVAEAIGIVRPYAVDVNSGVEARPGRKDPDKVRRFVAAAKARLMDRALPDARGHFGRFGGRFVPEMLMAPLHRAGEGVRRRPARPRSSSAASHALLADYAGRPTPALLRRAAHRALRRRPHLAQARGPLPHRRPQDQQRAWPGAARRAHG